MSAREAAGLLSQEAPQIGYRLGVIGTSLVQQNDLASSSLKISYSSRGWLRWAQVLSNNLFYCPIWWDNTVYTGWEPSGVAGTTRYFRGLNAGVSGQTFQQILDRKSYFNNIDVDIIVIDMGTNDVGSYDGNTIQNARETIANYYLSLGKIVILLPILARDTTAWASGSVSRKVANYINSRTRTFCNSRRNCYLFDWNQAWVDMNNPTDTVPVTGNTDDGTHFIPRGAYFVGKAFAAFLATILPAAQPRTWGVDDTYDATYNPYGNLITNPFMYGNSGANGTGSTGNVANGFRSERSTGGSTVVASKEVRADGRGSWQVLTYTPSGAAVDLFYLRTSTANTTHGLANGDWVQASCVVNAAAYAWRGITLYLADQVANSYSSYGMEPYPTATSSANNWQSTEGFQGTLTTVPFPLANGSTDVRVRLEIRFDASLGGTPVLKVGEFELRKVPNTISVINTTV